MIDFIKGALAELTPTTAVIECGGVGYEVNIALTTYAELSDKQETKLYIYEVIREDTHQLYGFPTKDERALFLQLVSVSGVGANTARVILSSYSASELQNIIVSGDSGLLKSIKGIGAKTAERIIVDLKDKVGKLEIAEAEKVAIVDNGARQEATAALVMLGYPQSASQKAVDRAMKENPEAKVAQIVKIALKMV
ncbi:MAG: Holliday junction branch migration protein RuvA [Paludibacteraceae bacterium]|nr:Holliday junction branch migration protein RuvA [Paludibacteraceae bacterium]